MMIAKTQLLTVAVALLIPVAAHANDIGGTAADPNDNQEFQDVHRTTTDIVIDGDLSEWSFNNPITDPLIGIPKIGRDNRVEGDPPNEFVVHEEFGGTWTGPEDQSSTTEFVWKAGSEDPEEDGLYIGIVVTDDYHENSANSGWNGDSMQMMVTQYDSEFMEHIPDDFALYNFALGGIEEELDPEAPELISHYERGFAFFLPAEDSSEVAIVRDTEAQKTYYELYFGAEALGLEVEQLAEGTQLGVAMAINDGDEDAPGQAGWVGLGAHSIVFGKTPAEAAVLTLAAEFVAPPCNPNTLGDIDGNGDVEFADFLILSANFGNEVDSHELGDLDCNGTVEFADFLTLSANFGGNVGGAAPVPEPSSLGLLGFSILFLGFLRRRRNV